MAKPRLVQVLCGPARHAIVALPYEPGVSSVLGLTVTQERAAWMVEELIDVYIEYKYMNPWCGLCRAPRTAWIFEDAALKFDTLEEALPHLLESAAQQAQLRETLERSKN